MEKISPNLSYASSTDLHYSKEGGGILLDHDREVSDSLKKRATFLPYRV